MSERLKTSNGLRKKATKTLTNSLSVVLLHFNYQKILNK